MKRSIFVFIFFLFHFNSFYSQNTVLAKAEEFKTLYNSNTYSGIYALLSDDFKKTISEADLTKFLANEVYANFGILQKNELQYTDNKERVVGHFQKGKLIINIAQNSEGKISLFELLPYYETQKKKRDSYLSDNKKTSPLDSLVDRLVGAYMQSPENMGLSIGILSNEQNHFYNYGSKKRDENILTTNQTVYEIGSLSKVFCGVLLAQAILEKKVNAEDDIRKYLPLGNYTNLELKGTPVKLIHLANHTSGLPRIPDDIGLQKGYDPTDPYRNYNREMVFSFLKKVELSAEPGTYHDYSNIGMALLGIILEKVYDKSFEELVYEKICLPLNLKQTYIKKYNSSVANLASGYTSEGQPAPYWNMNDLSAAGGLKSTTSDLLAFLAASLKAGNSVNALSLAATPTFTTGNTIGMGWHIIKTKQGNTLTWHNGGTFGFSGFMGFIKEKNCAVVILSNSGNMVDYISLGIMKYLQK